MLQLLAYYENNWGFFKHQISAIEDEATAKAFLKAVRSYAGKLRFPSTLYNAGIITDLPVWADRSELCLLIGPEALASIDVDALAALFNVDKAEVQVRIVMVDEFPIPGAVALLTTEDFFICKDTEYTTTSFFNGQTLSTNYFLHHWSILSVSPFVPAILFTTASGTETATATQAITDFEISADAETVEAGSKNVQISAVISGAVTVDDDAVDIPVVPDAATYEISASLTTVENEGQENEETIVTPIPLNSRTYIDRLGKLHLQKTGMSEGVEILITGTSTYVNPSGATETLTDTLTLTVA